MIARSLACTIVLMSAACSPYPYEKKVEDFSKSIDSLSKTIDEAKEAQRADIARQTAVGYRSRIAAGQVRLGLSDHCAVAGNGAPIKLSDDFSCQVEIVVKNGGREPIIRKEMTAPFHNAAKIVAKLKDYAAALAAITKSKDRDELDDASKGLCAAAAGIATAGSPPIGAILGPSCGLVAAGWGMTLDLGRYQVLKQGVTAVDDNVIPSLADSLGVSITDMASQRLFAQRDLGDTDLLDVKNTAGDSVATRGYYESRVLRLFEVTETMNATMRAIEPAIDEKAATETQVRQTSQAPLPKPSTTNKTAQALWKAHRELRLAIDRNDGQLAAASEALSAFSDKVQELRKGIAKEGD
jgi:hypothetical protein